MATAYYLTFVQVRVDPDTPGFHWRLSDEGRARTLSLVRADWLSRVTRIVTSDEARTVETAEIFAHHLKVPVEVDSGLRDVVRPTNDFLSVTDFRAAMAAFFAEPDKPPLPGWETARAAQARLAGAFEAQLAQQEPRRDVLFVGHGGAGALLVAHLEGNAPTADLFDPTGGKLFSVECRTRRLLFGWRPATLTL